MSVEMLNLDELEFQEITLHGTVYKFKVPPVESLQEIIEVESTVGDNQNAKEVMEIIATAINKAVPELPLEELKTLNGKQLQHLIVYIAGSDMVSVNMMARKKK